jgi:hypothetical protein
VDIKCVSVDGVFQGTGIIDVYVLKFKSGANCAKRIP